MDVTDAGGLVVQISADIKDLKTGLADAQNSVSGFGIKTVAIGQLVADGIEKMGKFALQFGIDSAKAYGESEQALIRLSSVVGTQAANALVQYAEALSKTTAYSDTSIIALENQLANFGLLPGSIKSATTAIMDFAARTGKDLPEAGQIFGQALAGQGRQLKQYQILVDAGATRTDNLNKVTAAMTEQFHGQAAMMKDTLLGSVDSLTNRYNALQQKIGQDLSPALKVLIGWLDKAFTSFEKLTGLDQQNMTATEKKIAGLKSEIQAQEDRLKVTTEVKDGILNETKVTDDSRTAINAKIKSLADQIKQLREQQKQEKATADAAAASATAQTGITGDLVNQETEMYRKLAQSTKDLRKDTEKEVQGQMLSTTQTAQKQYLDQMDAAKHSFENVASFSMQMSLKLQEDNKSWSSIWVNTFQSMNEKFSSSMAQLIVHGGSFRDAMKDIGQQILQEFIQQVIAKMVAAWMAAMLTMRAASAATGAAGMASAGAGGGVAAAGGSVVSGGGAGAGAGMGASLLMGAGVAAGAIGGTVLGNSLSKTTNDQKNAQIGTAVGTAAGAALFGPLGAAVGGTVGGAAGAEATRIRDELDKKMGTIGAAVATGGLTQLGSVYKSVTKSLFGGKTADGNAIADASRGLQAELGLVRDLKSAAKSGAINLDEYNVRAQAILATAGSQVQDYTGRGSVWASAINPTWSIYQSEKFVGGKDGKWMMYDPLTGALNGPTLWSPTGGGWIAQDPNYVPRVGAVDIAYAAGGIINEPTMMVGMHSGKRGIMGEAGPEAIVPMTGGGGGSGQVHIHINGTFIEGDPAKWQRIIREQIVPQIRRYTMVNPIGPFARRRGAA